MATQGRAAVFYDNQTKRKQAMYLVVLRCQFDDIPVRLCPTMQAAKEFVEDTDDVQSHLERNAYKQTSSVPICFEIVTFADDGTPVACVKA